MNLSVFNSDFFTTRITGQFRKQYILLLTFHRSKTHQEAAPELPGARERGYRSSVDSGHRLPTYHTPPYFLSLVTSALRDATHPCLPLAQHQDPAFGYRMWEAISEFPSPQYLHFLCFCVLQ